MSGDANTPGRTSQPVLAAGGATATAVVPKRPELKVSLQALLQFGSDIWSPATSHPIPEATVEIVGKNVKGLTKNNGVAILALTPDCDGKQTLRIAPKASQVAGGMAGPKLGKPNNPEKWLLRTFDLELELDARGVKSGVAPVVKLTVDPSGPAYAEVIQRKPDLLLIDWRPDFIRAYTRKPRSKPPTCVVIHHTGGGDVGSSLNRFVDLRDGTAASKGDKVAAHYLVCRDGHVVKLAHENEVVSQAGKAAWQGANEVNSYSVGIETVHKNHAPEAVSPGAPSFAADDFTAAQYASLVRLVGELRKAFPAITRQRVVGHGDVAIKDDSNWTLGRKGFEPDVHFDWKQLEDAGLCRKPITPAVISPVLPTAAPLPVAGQPPPPGASAQAGTPPVPVYYGIKQGGAGLIANVAKPGPHIIELKKDLFAIGYSISAKKTSKASEITDDKYDGAASAAVRAFEFRYMSGTRANLRKWPSAGHLSYETAALIKQVVADDKP